MVPLPDLFSCSIMTPIPVVIEAYLPPSDRFPLIVGVTARFSWSCLRWPSSPSLLYPVVQAGIRPRWALPWVSIDCKVELGVGLAARQRRDGAGYSEVLASPIPFVPAHRTRLWVSLLATVWPDPSAATFRYRSYWLCFIGGLLWSSSLALTSGAYGPCQWLGLGCFRIVEYNSVSH